MIAKYHRMHLDEDRDSVRGRFVRFFIPFPSGRGHVGLVGCFVPNQSVGDDARDPYDKASE